MKRSGRPHAGLNGEPSSRYPQLAIRLPPNVNERLHAIARAEQRPLWRVLMDALDAYDRPKRKRKS